MEIIVTGSMVLVDLRGAGDFNTHMQKAADALGMSAGELFSEISMASIATIQRKTIAGQKALLSTYITRGDSKAWEPISTGRLVISRLTVKTPHSRQYVEDSMHLVNKVFDTPAQAEEFYLELVESMEKEK